MRRAREVGRERVQAGAGLGLGGGRGREYGGGMETKHGGYGFGAFKGVFTPSILTIIGVVMYLRFGWVLGNLGIGRTLLLVTLCNSVTLLTGLSLSALATNREVRGGGAYYLVSRAFGAETGAAIGIPLFLSQAIATAFYAAGFTEALTSAVPAAAGWDPRVVGTATLLAMAAVSALAEPETPAIRTPVTIVA